MKTTIAFCNVLLLVIVCATTSDVRSANAEPPRELPSGNAVMDGELTVTTEGHYELPPGTWFKDSSERCLDITLTAAGELKITFVATANHVLLSDPPQYPKRVYRKVYAARHGRIEFDRIEEGRVVPATPERYEFDEERDEP